MRKAVLAFAIFFLAVPFISAESYLDSQKLTGEGTLGISSEVYFTHTYNDTHTGFSTGAPDPAMTWYTSYTLDNEFQGANISLGTKVSGNTSISGIFPYAESDKVFLWYISEGSVKRTVTVSISKMGSQQFSSGLDWTLELVPQNNKQGASTQKLDSSVNPSAVIYDGTGTRDGYLVDSSADFEYWSMDIRTYPLPEQVVGGSSFSGTITIGVSVS